jgi:lipopolysaccharide biosynthesis protein
LAKSSEFFPRINAGTTKIPVLHFSIKNLARVKNFPFGVNVAGRVYQVVNSVQVVAFVCRVFNPYHVFHVDKISNLKNFARDF